MPTRGEISRAFVFMSGIAPGTHRPCSGAVITDKVAIVSCRESLCSLRGDRLGHKAWLESSHSGTAKLNTRVASGGIFLRDDVWPLAIYCLGLLLERCGHRRATNFKLAWKAGNGQNVLVSKRFFRRSLSCIDLCSGKTSPFFKTF